MRKIQETVKLNQCKPMKFQQKHPAFSIKLFRLTDAVIFPVILSSQSWLVLNFFRIFAHEWQRPVKTRNKRPILKRPEHYIWENSSSLLFWFFYLPHPSRREKSDALTACG